MPPLFLLSVLFTFILLLGTSLANVEACGVTHVTFTELIVTKLIHHPTGTTSLPVEPTNALVVPINENGNSAGHCTVHGIPHQCGHTPDLGHYPNSTATQMMPMTGTVSSASKSETSVSGVGSHLTTFVTHKVSTSTKMSRATSSTSTSSATYVANSASTPVPSGTEALPSSSLSSKPKTSTGARPSVSKISGYPYGGSYPNKVLYTHNVHRANHSAPNLGWDQKLADAAHTWALTCQFRHNP